MRYGTLLLVTFLLVPLVACGSGTPSSPTGNSSPSTPGLLLETSAGEARLTRWAGGSSFIDYSWCYNIGIHPRATDRTMTIQRVEYTVVGPSGQVYNTKSETYMVGQKIGSRGSGGFFGCPTHYSDPDTARTVAPTYRTRIDYTFDDGSPSGTQTVTTSGPIVSKVPTQPLMTGLKVTHDIPPGGLRPVRPVTFTVEGQGGVPPYEFQWRLNGFSLRDWDPNPTLTWDGTLNGRTVTSGVLYMVVQGRSRGGTDVEAGERVDVWVWESN
jgi:hypothetical protein